MDMSSAFGAGDRAYAELGGIIEPYACELLIYPVSNDRSATEPGRLIAGRCWLLDAVGVMPPDP